MRFNQLPDSNLQVSAICLGTMTFGEQNTFSESQRIMDLAVDLGINFLDTAELYAIPRKEATQGASEQHIGKWMQARKNRNQLILATKIAGPSPNLEYIRNPLGYHPAQLQDAIDKSLQRLQTDYIDLYQLHWPERHTNMFGDLGYRHDPMETWEENFLEILQEMDRQIKAGKIRYFGLSNETPWGLMRFLELARKHDLPRPITLQNPYNLLNRTFEIGLAEIAMRESVALLPYSPLAFGMLTDKYHQTTAPADARLTLFPQMARYSSPQSKEAAAKYLALAQAHGLELPQMAIAYLLAQPFNGSVIIGATREEQLQQNVKSLELTLSEEVLQGIEQIHGAHPNPAP